MTEIRPSCSPLSGLFSNITFLETFPDDPIWKLYTPSHTFLFYHLPPHTLFFFIPLSLPNRLHILLVYYLSPLECQLQVRSFVCFVRCCIPSVHAMCQVLNKYVTKRWKKGRGGAFKVSNHMMWYMNSKTGDQEEWKDKLKGQKVLNVKIKEFLMLLHMQWEIYMVAHVF